MEIKKRLSFNTEGHRMRKTVETEMPQFDKELSVLSADDDKQSKKTISAGGSGMKKAKGLPQKFSSGGNIISQSHPNFNNLMKKNKKKLELKVI